MKKIGKIIILLCFFSLSIFLFIQTNRVYAISYENIDLNALNEIKDNQELLDTVNTVQISYESDLSLVNILSKCNNLEKLVVKKATINDLTFINDIEPSNEFELWLTMGYYNMDGLSNSHIKDIIIDSCYITNFSKGMNLENVEKIRIYSISGYEDIDYSNYANLKSLEFCCISISNYKTFFEQLRTIESLNRLELTCCDITDNDTKYLKELTNIISLELKECNISDISFLEDMEQLRILGLPINVDDLSVIKKLPNLKAIYWAGYEQLALTDDLVEYLDNNNIYHNKYESTLKNTLLDMVSEINIDDSMSIKEKVEKVIDYTSNYVVSHDTFYDSTYTSNSLLYIVHFKTGVCSNYSLLENALLRLIGVETFRIDGLIPVHMSELSGGFSIDEIKYDLAGHAWLMVQDENGLWYGWDPVQIDIETGEYDYENNREIWNSLWGKKYDFWKNPYEDDTYTLDDYQDGKYDSFNYYFAKRRNVTNKIGYNDYLNEVKITFDSNSENTIQSKQRIYKNTNSKLKKNEYIRNGYTFESWNTKLDGTGISYKDEEIININDNITLYAQWKRNTYTIQFDSNGANGIMADETAIIGQYILPECKFTNTNPNFEFDGWFVENENAVLKPGNSIYVSKDTRLIAQWKEKNIYTLSFNTDGGSSIENQLITDGDTAMIPEDPTKSGYTFIGWYEDSTCQYEFWFQKPITADTTIYAKWVSNESIIKSINIIIQTPTVGEEVTMDKDGEYWLWETQKPQMNITIPKEAKYHLPDDGEDSHYMYWVISDFQDDEWVPFIGKFEDDTDYRARISLQTDNEYYFDKNISITVNGKEADTIIYVGFHRISFGVVLTTEKQNETNKYKILEGENQTYNIFKGNDLTIRADGDLSKFIELKVDNVTIDSSNYTAISGSTVITIRSAYLNTLSEGEHDLTFVYSDGNATTKFTIVKSEADSNIDVSNEGTNESLTPNTGDNIFIWSCLLLISCIGFIIAIKSISRK